ncbi:hypothetical protein SNE40_000168 [Patella caerulea]|uniref:Farnesoic acid O-methyl transferase domain-containing protein n=1 Tax=Patella caerulea TaxID=87958 RepID=A0AAN8K4N9_PATCE
MVMRISRPRCKSWCALIILVITAFRSFSGEILSLEKGSGYTFFRNVENLTEKFFWVRGVADAVIGLFEETTENHVFRIVIGRLLNTQTRLYRFNKRVNQTDQPGLLLESNPKKFKPFWIKWTTDYFMFGAGSRVGEGKHFLSANNVTLRYIAVTTKVDYRIEYILDLSCSKVRDHLTDQL